jgi:hypothetical protein
VERRDRVVGVVLAAEQRHQLQLVQLRVEAVQVRYELLLRLRIGRFVEKLVEDLGLLDALGEPVVELEIGTDPGEGAVQVLGALRVVPDVRLGELAL